MCQKMFQAMDMLMQNLGCIQLHLPAEAFGNCGKLKPPLNTLFTVDSVGSITFQDMQRYLDLIVALFELCPKGASKFIFKKNCLEWKYIISFRTYI